MVYQHDNFPGRVQQLQRSGLSSTPPPPQYVWTVPQAHMYYSIPQSSMVGSREEYDRSAPKTNIASSQSPALDPAKYNSNMPAPGAVTNSEYFRSPMTRSTWEVKAGGELEPFPSLDSDIPEFNHAILDPDENTPIIDMRHHYGMNQHEADNAGSFNIHSTRRMSGSSYSMSSTGGMPEISNYRDMDSSETVPYASDCNMWRTLEPSANHLMSPMASPHASHQDSVVRGGSRSRGSPASHNNLRSSPYSLESPRFKRWSTGQTPTSTPIDPRSLSQTPDRFAPFGPRLTSHHSMPAYGSNAMSTFGLPTQNILYSQHHNFHSNVSPMLTPSEQSFHLDLPRPLPSQGLFRLLSSNADRHGNCSTHFADLSDPPNLFSSLHEEPSNPPESDMNPSDPDLVPHEQDLRFSGDLYTPRWVRGHGNKREGWCGLCKPGRWLVLKNSAFWYDKSFTHGVSAATGAAFQGPQDTRRTEGNLDVWEGLCGSCGDWIALVSSKKKGTTWFRHAYKCHTHPKVKDGPKRRRETHAGRVRATSSSSTTSSSYPVMQELSQARTPPNRFSTPTPVPDSATLQTFGLSSTSAPPTSSSTTTSNAKPPLRIASYPSSTPYLTPASATPVTQSFHTPVANLIYRPYTPTSTSPLHDSYTPTSTPSYDPPYTSSFMNHVHTPTTSFPGSPAVGLFNNSLHPFDTPSAFSNTNSPSYLTFAHQISEPETMGIRSATAGSNSIASMI